MVDLTPQGIIARLDLREPIFRKTAAYGHFGRDDVQFTWEQEDLVEALRGRRRLSRPGQPTDEKRRGRRLAGRPSCDPDQALPGQLTTTVTVSRRVTAQAG